LADQTAPPWRIGAPHAVVELIADQNAVVPGGSLWLGVRFTLDPGWHIYWVNPGDSGAPPALSWHLPGGFRASPAEWPVPERIPVSSLVNYGYHGDVVLPVEIRVPSRLEVGRRTALGATVKWLVCRELCIPGDARLELAMPVRPSSQPPSSGSSTLIARARARVPRDAPASWKTSAFAEGDSLVLSVETGRPEREGVFFPLEVSQINDSAPQRVTPLERGLRFTLRQSNQLVKLPASLKGVVRFADGRAFVIAAPLVQPEIRESRGGGAGCAGPSPGDCRLTSADSRFPEPTDEIRFLEKRMTSVGFQNSTIDNQQSETERRRGAGAFAELRRPRPKLGERRPGVPAAQ
jgi:thiol:disulfide interchange protein DsbD